MLVEGQFKQVAKSFLWAATTDLRFIFQLSTIVQSIRLGYDRNVIKDFFEHIGCSHRILFPQTEALLLGISITLAISSASA